MLATTMKPSTTNGQSHASLAGTPLLKRQAVQRAVRHGKPGHRKTDHAGGGCCVYPSG